MTYEIIYDYDDNIFRGQHTTYQVEVQVMCTYGNGLHLTTYRVGAITIILILQMRKPKRREFE